MSNNSTSANFNPLVIISGLVGVSALGGGIYGMAGAKGTPLDLLEGSVFQNYFIPSLILFLVVGGSSLIAAFKAFKKHSNIRRIGFVNGLIILAWIVAQLKIIGYVSWLQPIIAIAGISIIFLSGNLSQKIER